MRHRVHERTLIELHKGTIAQHPGAVQALGTPSTVSSVQYSSKWIPNPSSLRIITGSPRVGCNTGQKKVNLASCPKGTSLYLINSRTQSKLRREYEGQYIFGT